MWSKIKTASVVILLSGLIWVFAEREVLKQTDTVVAITLDSSRQDVLVEFAVDKSSGTASVTRQNVEITVQGPAGRIKDIDEGRLTPRMVNLNIEKLGYPQMEESGTLTVRVLDLLKEKIGFEESDATVTATEAKPKVLQVRLTKLVWTPLQVKVYDQQDNELTPQRLECQTDGAFLPAGANTIAKVSLTADQQSRATSELILVYAKAPPPARPPEIAVKLKLPEGGSLLPTDTIPLQRIRIGIVKPTTMEGIYEVIIEENLDEVRRAYGPIKVRGSSEALTAFMDPIQSPYHLILEVREEDLKTPSPARSLRYLLPEGHPELEIIKKVGQAVRFKIIPIKTTE